MMFNADSHASSAEAIAEALAHELETLTQVVETLDIEHEALMGSDAERLEQAVAAKQRAIAAHAQARHAREALGLKDNLQQQVESHPGFFNGLKDRALEHVDALRENGAKSKNAMHIHSVYKLPLQLQTQNHETNEGFYFDLGYETVGTSNSLRKQRENHE